MPIADSTETHYAWVLQMLGDRRVKLRMVAEGKECIGVIRGNMRKRQWISTGDLILVSTREFQDDKVDILFKYSDDEIRRLRKFGEPVGSYSMIEHPTADNEDTIVFEEADDIDAI